MHDDRARQQPRRDRTVNERAADHAAIDRLADELLPALVAKLSATGLGEIEVREGPWRVRIRRPADGEAGNPGRRAADRPSRAQPGHAGHGHAPGAFETPINTGLLRDKEKLAAVLQNIPLRRLGRLER